MLIGIPEALLFYKYEPFIKSFIGELGIKAVYSGPSDRDKLERGIKSCVDEACLPIKIFHGHVSKLREECDKIMVPRLMKCEYGESICPKFAGLPEMVKSGSGRDDLIFTGPMYLNDRDRLEKSLIRDARSIGISPSKIRKALNNSYDSLFIKNTSTEFAKGDKPVIALLGHPYNTGDPFVNMNIIKKLNRSGIRVVTADSVPHDIKVNQLKGLMKDPYWLFLRDNYGAALYLASEKKVDGIIYLSSFCCGTDSITIELIRSKLGSLPMLVLKLDEHTGEAGFNTRIEAFSELLERRTKRANDFPEIGGQPHIRPSALSGNRNRIDYTASQ